MQGRPVGHEENGVTRDLQAVIPSNHLVRRVAKVVDLSFIYELTQDLYGEDNGRPSVDPVLFFRMQLMGHLFGKLDNPRCQQSRIASSNEGFG